MRSPEDEAYLKAIRDRVVADGWNAADAELAFVLDQLAIAENPPVAHEASYVTETDATVRTYSRLGTFVQSWL